MWGPTDKNVSCHECQVIAHELNQAYARSWVQNQAAPEALRALVGGTEEDAERADQILPPFRCQTSPGFPRFPEGLHEIMIRGALHAARTGHFVRRARG